MSDLSNRDWRKTSIITEIKDLATEIGRTQNIPRHRALLQAAQQKGFRSYDAAVTAVKHGSVDSDKPVVFCCRCSTSTTEDMLVDSTLSTIYASFKLCHPCLSKERKDLRRGWRSSERIRVELVAWYGAPKLKQAGALCRALIAQKNISAGQAGAIVAHMFGYQSYDMLIVAAENFYLDYKAIQPKTTKKAILRRKRVTDMPLNIKRRKILNLSKKIREARLRTANMVFEESSGTMHSRVDLLTTHCSPIDAVATKVVFKPYSS